MTPPGGTMRTMSLRRAGLSVLFAGCVVGYTLTGGLAIAGETSVARTTFKPPAKAPAIPGALPAGFRYRYAEARRGWPVRPDAVQHPIRGSFLDPRGSDNDGLAGYHFGVDINVDDNAPEPGAPQGMSHRVFALESGVVSFPVKDATRTCGNRRLDAGHFAYWHTSPIVRSGTRVRAGQQIGWTCVGEWHVHVSEWQAWQGTRVWVNPLHRGGKLVPYASTLTPIVADLRFHTPPSRPWKPAPELSTPDSSQMLPPGQLRGLVELRARVSVPQSFVGFLAQNARWPTDHHPYRLAVEIRSVSSGAVVLRRTTFQSDQLPLTPFLVHFAPGSAQNDSMGECLGAPASQSCRGEYWFRPLSRYRQEFWNTRGVQNGLYRVTVTAWSFTGNAGRGSVDVTVAN